MNMAKMPGRKNKRSPRPSLGSAVGSLLGGPSATGGSSGPCPPLELIFARGTTEIQGTFGIVGRPLCKGLQAKIPGTQCYDTQYSSDAEYLISPRTGAATASKYLASIAARCPSTKFVLGGYSKGGMVVHSIKGQNIVGAVTFGDPYKLLKLSTTPNFKTFCHVGDPVCLNGVNVFAHVTYPLEDINQAVDLDRKSVV